MEKRELVIIGAGPAGMTAAIYGRRAGLDVLLLEKGAAGARTLRAGGGLPAGDWGLALRLRRAATAVAPWRDEPAGRARRDRDRAVVHDADPDAADQAVGEGEHRH